MNAGHHGLNQSVRMRLLGFAQAPLTGLFSNGHPQHSADTTSNDEFHTDILPSIALR